MDRIEFDLCMKIHGILKNKIKGRIFISVKDDKNLHININPGNSIMYRWITENALQYRTMDDVYRLTNTIIGEYREWINNRFFFE